MLTVQQGQASHVSQLRSREHVPHLNLPNYGYERAMLGTGAAPRFIWVPSKWVSFDEQSHRGVQGRGGGPCSMLQRAFHAQLRCRSATNAPSGNGCAPWRPSSHSIFRRGYCSFLAADCSLPALANESRFFLIRESRRLPGAPRASCGSASPCWFPFYASARINIPGVMAPVAVPSFSFPFSLILPSGPLCVHFAPARRRRAPVPDKLQSCSIVPFLPSRIFFGS